MSDLEHYVQEKIQSGEFDSADDFVTEAIRVYRDLERGHELLKQRIQQRIAEADTQSEPLDIDSIKSQLTDELDKNGRPK